MLASFSEDQKTSNTFLPLNEERVTAVSFTEFIVKSGAALLTATTVVVCWVVAGVVTELY